MRDRSWAGKGQRERETQNWSRLQALSCQHRAQREARTHKLWDHDLNQSQTLNRLSHRGAPAAVIFYLFCFSCTGFPHWCYTLPVTVYVWLLSLTPLFQPHLDNSDGLSSCPRFLPVSDGGFVGPAAKFYFPFCSVSTSFAFFAQVFIPNKHIPPQALPQNLLPESSTCDTITGEYFTVEEHLYCPPLLAISNRTTKNILVYIFFMSRCGVVG